jgi:hypothetical protein
LAATRSHITRRDDDRELQTEQTIVGLPARELQPDRTDARSWFGMTFAKDTAAWRSPRSAFGGTSPLARVSAKDRKPPTKPILGTAQMTA